MLRVSEWRVAWKVLQDWTVQCNLEFVAVRRKIIELEIRIDGETIVFGITLKLCELGSSCVLMQPIQDYIFLDIAYN